MCQNPKSKNAVPLLEKNAKRCLLIEVAPVNFA
jgi:hypothetical protein